MIKGDKEYLDGIVKTHQCPEHGKKLVVAWHAGENSYVIRCGEGHFPDEVTRELTPTQEHKAGKREAHKPGLDLLPRTDLATGELLIPEMIKALVDYAHKYGLDPYRGHVVLMYGKPYITLDAYLYHANEQKIPYDLKSRPLTKEERVDYQVDEGDYAWIAFLNINHGDKYFSGIGVITRRELEEEAKGKPGVKRYPIVAEKPWQMCQKRAEWQVMRRGFPIGESEEKKEE